MAIGDRVIKYSIILKTIVLKNIFKVKSVSFDLLYVFFEQLLKRKQIRHFLVDLQMIQKAFQTTKRKEKPM